MAHLFYSTTDFEFAQEVHANPWVIIYAKQPYKELSDMPKDMYEKLFSYALEVEKVMRAYYESDKINIASFGNVLPKVHMHIQARFEADDYFPNPLWGEKRGTSFVCEKPFEGFKKALIAHLEAY